MLKRVAQPSSNRKKFMVPIRHQYEAVPKSILRPQYGFLASSCDSASLDSIQLKILQSAKGKFTM